MVHNTIQSLVNDLQTGKPQATLANCNDPGYAFKKILEHCNFNHILCFPSHSTRYFNTYYMGEHVNVSFELPIISIIVNGHRYELQASEDPNDNIVVADLLPDDYEVQQDIKRLNYMLDNRRFDSSDDMWDYIQFKLTSLYNYVKENLKSLKLNAEQLLDELGVHLIQ